MKFSDFLLKRALNNNDYLVGCDSDGRYFRITVQDLKTTLGVQTVRAESVMIQYSVNGNVWHSTYTEGDLYMRVKCGSGPWSGAIRISVSAYETWKEQNGGTGTVEEFLAAMGNFGAITSVTAPISPLLMSGLEGRPVKMGLWDFFVECAAFYYAVEGMITAPSAYSSIVSRLSSTDDLYDEMVARGYAPSVTIDGVTLDIDEGEGVATLSATASCDSDNVRLFSRYCSFDYYYDDGKSPGEVISVPAELNEETGVFSASIPRFADAGNYYYRARVRGMALTEYECYECTGQTEISGETAICNSNNEIVTLTARYNGTEAATGYSFECRVDGVYGILHTVAAELNNKDEIEATFMPDWWTNYNHPLHVRAVVQTAKGKVRGDWQTVIVQN